LTSDNIREVALRHFSRNGYKGASLADISAEVGIKKQSIYAHFSGKDELFLSVFREVAAREELFVEEYLKRSGLLSLEKMLYGFLSEYRKRYKREEDTKFFLRMAFFPPRHLQKEIVEYCNRHLDRMGEQLAPYFESAANSGGMDPEVTTERALAAFTAVLDGVFVEMLYGGFESSLKRLDASWYIYWRGVRNN